MKRCVSSGHVKVCRRGRGSSQVKLIATLFAKVAMTILGRKAQPSVVFNREELCKHMTTTCRL